MTTDLINNPAGITEGTNLVVANTAVVGSDAFTNLDGGGTIQAATVNGRQWYHFNSTTAASWRWGTSVFPADNLCTSIFKVRFGATPGSTFQLALHRNGATSSACRWDITTGLVPQVKNNGGSTVSSFTALSTNTDYYLAMASDAANQTVEAKIYTGTTLSQTLAKTTTTTTTAQHYDYRIGKYTDSAGSVYIADIRVVIGSATLLTPADATSTPAGYRKIVMYASV